MVQIFAGIDKNTCKFIKNNQMIASTENPVLKAASLIEAAP